MWADPDYRAKWMVLHRAIWDDPAAAAERRALLKKVWSDPGKSARKSALVKSQWTLERRAQQSAWIKARLSEPGARAAAVAKSNATKAAKRAIKESQHDRPKADMFFHSGRPQKI